MILKKHIKPMPPWFEKLVPFHGCLLLKTILLKQAIYNDLQSPKPNPRNVAVLLHEEVHYQHTVRDGLLKFVKIYASPKTRLAEELEAYGVQMEHLKSHGLDFDIEIIAEALSSWIYLWCTDYNTARKKLEQIWNSFPQINGR